MELISSNANEWILPQIVEVKEIVSKKIIANVEHLGRFLIIVSQSKSKYV